MKEYIANLIRQCLDAIPNLPEVANLIRIPKEHWAVHAELKDEIGTLYQVKVSWQFCDEAKEGSFILIAVHLGTRKLYFRGLRIEDDEHDNECMFYVGIAPYPVAFNAWYEGGVVNGNPTCTCCGITASTVQQAYYGGTHIPNVARCKTCRQRPYPSKKPHPFNSTLLPVTLAA